MPADGGCASLEGSRQGVFSPMSGIDGLDGQGALDFADLLALLADWGDHFCPVPLC